MIKVDPLLSETLKDDLLKVHLINMLKFPNEPYLRNISLEKLKKYLFNYLYLLISNNGELFPIIFPGMPSSEIPKDIKDIHPDTVASTNNSGNNNTNSILYDLCNDRYLELMSKKPVRGLTLPFTGHKFVTHDHNNNNTDDSVNNSNIDNESHTHVGNKSVLETSNESESSARYNHAGRYCGRKFKPGEPIYRCQECGFDETCVLCIHCFNSRDHEGHHVYVDVCTGSSNGICDCGDHEAWPVELNCKATVDALNGSLEIQQQKDLLESFSPLFEEVLRTILDYFIDVFNQNFESMPNFTTNITLKLRKFIQSGEITKRNNLLKNMAYKNKYIEVDEDLVRDPKNYTVMVYNDEFHNYSQATSALRQGEPDNSRTEYLTTLIDEEGRTMLKSSTELGKVLGGFFSVQTNGLSATLTSWTEYLHQETASFLIKWIKDCLDIENPEFQSVFRNSLCKVLCEEVGVAGYEDSQDVSEIIESLFGDVFEKKPHTAMSTDQESSVDADEFAEEHKYGDVSVLGPNNKIPLGHHIKMDPNYLDSISLHVNPRINLKKNYKNSRLQYMLFFDNRYWKSLRRNVQDILIPTLSSSNNYRVEFCVQFSEIFTHMLNSVCYIDREPQLTALKETILQIFSCTTHANLIMESKAFVDIIWAVNRIFMNFSALEDGAMLWKRVSVINPSKGFAISFKQGLFSIETLLHKISSSTALLEPEIFIPMVTLFQLFNGAYKIKHKEGDHVLREDQFFIPYMEYTISIFSIIQVFDKVLRKGFDEVKLFNAARLVYTYLINRTPYYKTTQDEFEIIKFRVSKQRVAYMNPVHTFFAHLIENLPLLRVMDLVNMYNKDFLMAADYNLRSIILCSQIDIGFWVRNGFSVLHQSTFYKKNPEISAYSKDIYMNQLAFLVTQDELARTIYNMLDRWEILEWFLGAEDFEHTVYGDKIVLLTQQFLSFVYHLISERFMFRKFDSYQDKDSYSIKETIKYSLFSKSLPYSKLLESVPDVLTEQPSVIDECLNEVAEYVPPTGLEDNGVFKLRDNHYKSIDPLRLLNLDDDFENSANIVQKNLFTSTEYKKSKQFKKETDIIVQPVLESYENLVDGASHLAAFTRTDLFSKLVYKLFHQSIESGEYSFLYELLHLLHAVFVDDELVNGPESFPDAYIRKPVCNHLLAIILGANIAVNVKSKADYLLKIMLTKRQSDVQDSLVSCFGEETFKSYYETLSNNAKGTTEETEQEKKKRLAKQRQAKLMNRFKNKQAKFMKENKDLLESENQSLLENNSGLTETSDVTSGIKSVERASSHICDLCQEGHSNEDLFVIPLFGSQTPSLRPPSKEGDEYAQSWNGFTNTENNSQFYRYTKPTDLSIKSINDVVYISCNHAVHYKCIKKFWHKKNYSKEFFICPLCQTVCNKVLPVFDLEDSNSNKVQILDDILNQEDSDNYKLLPKFQLSASGKNVLDKIVKNQEHYDVSYFNGNDTKKYTPFILAAQLANTIGMLEVASRLSVNARSDFLAGKEQSYKTLRYLLNAIVTMRETYGNVPNFRLPYSHEVYSKSPNKAFQFFVREFIFTNTKLPTLLYSIIRQLFSNIPDYIQKVDTSALYKKLVEAGENYVPNEKLVELFDIRFSLEEMTVGYTIVLKQLQCLLRKIMIFYKVLDISFANDIPEEVFINKINISDSAVGSDVEDYCNLLINILTNSSDLAEFLSIHKPCVHEKAGLQNQIQVQRSTLIFCSQEKCSVTEYELGQSCQGEYTGVVKLIDLSKHLNKYLTDISTLKFSMTYLEPSGEEFSSDRMDYEICLTCGAKLKYSSDDLYIGVHSLHCFKDYGIFFIPNLNQLSLFMAEPRCVVPMAAPYLNAHGETGKLAMRRGDLSTLSLKRYEHINQLWLTLGIPGLISRMLGDGFRMLITTSRTTFNNGIFRFNTVFTDDQEPEPTNDSDNEIDEDEAMMENNENHERDQLQEVGDLGDRYLYYTDHGAEGDESSEDDYSDDGYDADGGAEGNTGSGNLAELLNPANHVTFNHQTHQHHHHGHHHENEEEVDENVRDFADEFPPQEERLYLHRMPTQAELDEINRLAVENPAGLWRLFGGQQQEEGGDQEVVFGGGEDPGVFEIVVDEVEDEFYDNENGEGNEEDEQFHDARENPN